MIKNYILIISNTSRSISYLQNLKKNNLYPYKIIYLNDHSKNKYHRLLITNKFYFPNVKIKIFNSNILDESISTYILNEKINNYVYSGYPGKIIKNLKILSKKNFIHCHPGRLPNYRGSTTIYYSVLKDRNIYCTTIILNKNVDCGKILCTKKYNQPKKISDIDQKYDDLIRSKNLVYVIKNEKKLKKETQKKTNTQPYYVIHPLLRALVLNRMR